MATAGKRRPREPHQLPPGRHGLPRAFVARNQRERIISAVAETVCQTGYTALTVKDIIEVAGVSRRTFYQHFKSKEEAFLGAYDAVVAQLVAGMVEAWEAVEGFGARTVEGLEAMFDFAVNEPEFARLVLVEALSAGPRAQERRTAMIKGFAQVLVQGAIDELPRAGRPPEVIAQVLAGGVYELMTEMVREGRGGELLALLPEVVGGALLPYVGPEATAAEQRRLRRRMRARERP